MVQFPTKRVISGSYFLSKLFTLVMEIAKGLQENIVESLLLLHKFDENITALILLLW